jgi:hypothetical protein
VLAGGGLLDAFPVALVDMLEHATAPRRSIRPRTYWLTAAAGCRAS